MRTLLAFASGAALATTLSAQSPNLFHIYPSPTGATTYTSRGTLGVAPGEFLQEVPATFFAGIGDSGTACTATAIAYATQDQNPSTQETYSVVVRSAASGGGPDVTAAGAIVLGGPLTTPASTSTTPVYWNVTTTFSSPITLPCSGTFYMGLQFGPAPGWTGTVTDGQSIHVAYYTTSGTQPTIGDNPRGNAPNHAWVADPTAMTASLSAPGQVLLCGLNVGTPVLNLGNVDPSSARSPSGISYGAGGLYPRTTDGINARIRDAASAGGRAFLLIGIGVLPTGLPLPGFGGSIWLNPGGPIVSGGSTTMAGTEVVLPVAAPATLPSTLSGTVYFQAVTVDGAMGNPRFSNVAGTNF